MDEKAAACFEEGRREVLESVSVFIGDKKPRQNRRGGGGGEGEGFWTTATKKDKVECRICQEEDEVASMESPCACDGTLKFAHRKCIQRWCIKKGDINCEICNQVFSPDYSLPPSTTNPDILAIDVRQSWGPTISLQDSHLVALAAAERQILQSDFEEYAIESNSCIVCLRPIALILLIILLLSQALLIIRETGLVQGSSKLFNFQVSVLQFASFLLPCCVIGRSWYIQSRRRQV
ncbi:hypothetical protein SAY87_024515 [Trapa incisa]|uniref:RING-CH-type domain-containing protein n=1 Tax=Trapa incisa TaxID=236973 RepID=A0AAN7GKZ2_9MYRT|nr:hypothetical protein SAY87_024515 [Trapa incisa]